MEPRHDDSERVVTLQIVLDQFDGRLLFSTFAPLRGRSTQGKTIQTSSNAAMWKAGRKIGTEKLLHTFPILLKLKSPYCVGPTCLWPRDDRLISKKTISAIQHLRATRGF
jgi:hypothetical protein